MPVSSATSRAVDVSFLGRQHLILDRLAQHPLQLPVQGRVVVLIDAADAVSKVGQGVLRAGAGCDVV